MTDKKTIEDTTKFNEKLTIASVTNIFESNPNEDRQELAQKLIKQAHSQNRKYYESFYLAVGLTLAAIGFVVTGPVGLITVGAIALAYGAYDVTVEKIIEIDEEKELSKAENIAEVTENIVSGIKEKPFNMAMSVSALIAAIAIFTIPFIPIAGPIVAGVLLTAAIFSTAIAVGSAVKVSYENHQEHKKLIKHIEKITLSPSNQQILQEVKQNEKEVSKQVKQNIQKVSDKLQQNSKKIANTDEQKNENKEQEDNSPKLIERRR